MKKILIFGCVVTLLVGCNGDSGIVSNGTSHTSISPPVVHASQPVAPDVPPVAVPTSPPVTHEAPTTFVIGQVTIPSESYNVTFIPVDPVNEDFYTSFPVGSDGQYSSDCAVNRGSMLMPHRKYKVSLTMNDGSPTPPDLQFKFALTGALDQEKLKFIPAIFDKIMLDSRVFTSDSNNNLSYNQNLQLIYESSSASYTGTVTPFYAGNLTLVDSNDQDIADVQVGEFVNPLFENLYHAPHPLLGGDYLNRNNEGGKFSIGNKYSQNLGFDSYNLDYLPLDLKYAKDKYASAYNSPAYFFGFNPRDTLLNEGRYFPIDLIYVYLSDEVDFFINYNKYNNFQTTLPIPILFYTSGFYNDYRVCSTNIFYTDDNSGNVTMYGQYRYNNNSLLGESNINSNQWGSAYCISAGNNVRYDVGGISDYDDNSQKDYKIRVNWWQS